jgi:hypothetical protein
MAIIRGFVGSGFDTPERNKTKVVCGLEYVRPFPVTPILKGFQLAYDGTYGESNNQFAPGSGNANDLPTWQVNVLQGSLQHPSFTVMGQYNITGVRERRPRPKITLGKRICFLRSCALPVSKSIESVDAPVWQSQFRSSR